MLIVIVDVSIIINLVNWVVFYNRFVNSFQVLLKSADSKQKVNLDTFKENYNVNQKVFKIHFLPKNNPSRAIKVVVILTLRLEKVKVS